MAVAGARPAQSGASLDHDTAMLVNEHGVALEEFRWFMQQERAAVFQHFKTKHNLEDEEGLWNHACDGTTPRALLKTNTIQRLTREKTEQLLFEELGLIPDTRYSTFVESFMKLSREREQAAKEGRTVYGPIRYSQLQFFGHWKASLQIQALEKLAQGRLEVTDQSVRAFYHQNKEAFRTSGSFVLEIAFLQPAPESSPEARQAEIQSAAREILSRLEAD